MPVGKNNHNEECQIKSQKQPDSLPGTEFLIPPVSGSTEV